jgi:hypothetical protein
VFGAERSTIVFVSLRYRLLSLLLALAALAAIVAAPSVPPTQ